MKELSKSINPRLDDRKKVRSLAIIAIIGIVAFAAVIGLFIYRFMDYDYSRNPNDFAVFGSYVGGTVSAIFTFFAFLVLLYNTYQQYQTVKQTIDEQRKISEKRRKPVLLLAC